MVVASHVLLFGAGDAVVVLQQAHGLLKGLGGGACGQAGEASSGSNRVGLQPAMRPRTLCIADGNSRAHSHVLRCWQQWIVAWRLPPWSTSVLLVRPPHEGLQLACHLQVAGGHPDKALGGGAAREVT